LDDTLVLVTESYGAGLLLATASAALAFAVPLLLYIMSPISISSSDWLRTFELGFGNTLVVFFKSDGDGVLLAASSAALLDFAPAGMCIIAGTDFAAFATANLSFMQKTLVHSSFEHIFFFL
jgi:hypothetical protein